MTSPLRLLAFALLLAPSLLPAAENQRFILERPYPVAEIPEPDRSLPVTNVILMIGDGMGIHHLSAAWAANRGRLFIENCPVTGISKTWCADKLVTDSAAAGTAMATGTKTLYHRVAVCPKGNRLEKEIPQSGKSFTGCRPFIILIFTRWGFSSGNQSVFLMWCGRISGVWMNGSPRWNFCRNMGSRPGKN